MKSNRCLDLLKAANLRFCVDKPPEVWMLLIMWLKKLEVRICSLLDSQNKLSLTTSVAYKLCCLQNDLQANTGLGLLPNRELH